MKKPTPQKEKFIAQLTPLKDARLITKRRHNKAESSRVRFLLDAVEQTLWPDEKYTWACKDDGDGMIQLVVNIVY